MADLRIPDLNKVFLAGRLTRDPDLRYIPSGTAVCELGMAVSRKYRDKQGELQEDTVFVNVTCWAKTAEYVGENYKKGRPVMVEGRLKSDEWETQGKEKRNKLTVTADRVQALDWEDRGEKRIAPAETEIPEDDIPF